MRRPAVFLDRDGTINHDGGYVHRAEDFRFLAGATRAIRRLNRARYWVIVVTNQAGVARGYYTEDDVRRLHNYISQELAQLGAVIDAYYYSPFHPDYGGARYCRDSNLRKPGTGLFEQACQDFAIDVDSSWMVGDAPSDMEFARRCGLRPICVGLPATHQAHTSCPDLPAAVEFILATAPLNRPRGLWMNGKNREQESL